MELLPPFQLMLMPHILACSQQANNGHGIESNHAFIPHGTVLVKSILILALYQIKIHLLCHLDGTTSKVQQCLVNGRALLTKERDCVMLGESVLTSVPCSPAQGGHLGGVFSQHAHQLFVSVGSVHVLLVHGSHHHSMSLSNLLIALISCPYWMVVRRPICLHTTFSTQIHRSESVN